MTLLRKAIVVVLMSSPAWAQVSTDQIAEVRADEAKAMKEIAAKYEGRKLTSAERKQRGREEAAAKDAVMKKHGVDPKEFTRAQAKLSRADQQKVKAKVEQLTEEKKAAPGGGDDSGGGDEPGGLQVEVGGKAGDSQGSGGIEIQMPDDEN